MWNRPRAWAYCSARPDTPRSSRWPRRRRALEVTPARPRGNRESRGGALDRDRNPDLGPEHGLEEMPAPPPLEGEIAQRIEDPRQTRAAEVRHAEGPQPRSGKSCSEYKGTICVCCNRASQRCSSWSLGMTLRTTGRPASAVRSPGRSSRTAPRPSSASKWNGPRGLPTSGKVGARGEGPEHAVAAQKQLQLLLPLGEPADHLHRSDLVARIAAEANLLVDQADGRFRAQARVAGQQVLRRDGLTALPGRGQFVDLPRDPRIVRGVTEALARSPRYRAVPGPWASSSPSRCGVRRGADTLAKLARRRATS